MAQLNDQTANMQASASPYPTEGKDANKTPSFDPGELAPFWATPFPPAKLSEDAQNSLKALCDLVGNKDVAARRWEVEQSWEARLYDRGYQYLLPRKGGGWIMPPFATDYNRAGGRRNGQKWYGYETNIYTTYGEIITAALTRDIPAVRFQPQDPTDDKDITAARGATKYSRIFSRNNDLLDVQHQMVYYLRNDGRAVTVVNHILDAQRFGRAIPEETEVVPEDVVSAEPPALVYLVRHGETAMNANGQLRGRSEVPLDERGERQAFRAADWLKDKGIVRLICSPVERALETAQEISEETGLQIEPDDRIASLDIGDMAGMDAADSKKQIQEYEDKPDEPFPGGESLNDFYKRVQEALFEALQQSDNGPIAIVTHDSVISAAFRILHGEDVPPDAQIMPGGIAAVRDQQDGTYTVQTIFPYNMPEPPRSQKRGAPLGMEVVEVYGKLEAKVPINAQVIEDCVFVQVSKEYDYAYVKGMFPDKADKIKPGSAGAGENELDRIARINACLALEASYVTGDSMVRDCTVQRTWFRPAMFMEVENVDVRQELMSSFPDGCLCVLAGEAFMFARNESMDDHVTIIQAFPGSGMNRIALCSKLLSVQKRVNNWIDLLNDYFIRCVPSRWFNSAMIAPEALKAQSNVPGNFIPYDAAAIQNQAATGIPPIWVEDTPQQNNAMPQFIQFFLNELPQLLVGALPSLFGGQSNTDASGVMVAMQRDQALGRLGTPWHSIQVATARYFKQAVQLAAKMRTKPIMGLDGDSAVRIELTELKGNIMAFPEEDSNFPESWVQKQSRYQQLLMDAGNPVVMNFLTASPMNLRTAAQMAGIPELDMPQADSWDKQLGEIEILLKSGPVPNPQKQQAMMQADQMVQQIAAAHGSGMVIPPEQIQAAQQAQQQAISLPDQVSSLQINQFSDDHASEKACCLWWLNSATGRAHKNGSPEQRAGALNVELHAQAHSAAMPAPQPQVKPPSVSMNYKDLPPAAGAALLQKTGLPSDPQQVAGDRVAQEQLKHPTEINL